MTINSLGLAVSCLGITSLVFFIRWLHPATFSISLSSVAVSATLLAAVVHIWYHHAE